MTRSKLLLVALMVSVAINLLVAGIFIGRGGIRPPPGPSPAAWMAADLDQETRQKLRQRMAGQASDVRPIRQELRRAMGDLRAAVRAEDYDPQAMADALARMREARGRYENFLHNNLVELSGELNREQRMALLRTALQRGMTSGGRYGKPGSRSRSPDAADALSDDAGSHASAPDTNLADTKKPPGTGG